MAHCSRHHSFHEECEDCRRKKTEEEDDNLLSSTAVNTVLTFDALSICSDNSTTAIPYSTGFNGGNFGGGGAGGSF